MTTAETERLIAALEDLAERLEIELRTEPVDEGGLVELRGKRLLIVPQGAPREQRLAVLLDALARQCLDDIYVIPVVREALETHRRA